MPPKKMTIRSPRRRTYRKRATARVPRTMVRNNHVFIKRMFTGPTIGRTPALGWGATPLQFALNQLPSYSELQAVFDAYKIHAVKVTFTPYWDSNDLANQTGFTTVLPRVYTVVDRNGFPAGSLATENQFLESAKARLIRKPQEPFSIYIKNPGVEAAAERTGSAFTQNGVNMYSPWLDTSSSDIGHWGCAIGMIIPAGSPDSGFFYNTTITYYMQFKNAV